MGDDAEQRHEQGRDDSGQPESLPQEMCALLPVACADGLSHQRRERHDEALPEHDAGYPEGRGYGNGGHIYGGGLACDHGVHEGHGYLRYLAEIDRDGEADEASRFCDAGSPEHDECPLGKGEEVRAGRMLSALVQASSQSLPACRRAIAPLAQRAATARYASFYGMKFKLENPSTARQ